ncbi:hypothetical protein [Nannocystis pusilla]|uniref:hypothetical protein n=1 Tax=Nannocystis pusilla TaxID=889268 RepID=UPI003B78F479
MDDADEPAGVARVEFDEAEERSLVRLAGAMGLVGLLQVLWAGSAWCSRCWCWS